MDKSFHELMAIIQCAEAVSAKIQGVLDEAEICRIVKEKFSFGFGKEGTSGRRT